MKDLLNYVPVLLALATGVLGVIFGKGGDRNPLKPVSYAFIALILGTAAYGAFDVWTKAAKNKAERIESEQRQNELKDEAAAYRRMLELGSFELGRAFTYGIFYIDFGVKSDLAPDIPKGFNGPVPTFGRAGVRGTISFKIDGVFDYQYEVTSGPGGSVTLAGSSSQTFKADRPDCYQNASGECAWQEQEGPPADGDWWVDFIEYDYMHGVKLASPATLNLLAARALKQKSYGSMVFRDPAMTADEYGDVVKGVKAMAADFKFYAPLRLPSPKGCPSVIHMLVDLELAPTSKPGHVVIDLVPQRERFSAVECEEPRF